MHKEKKFYDRYDAYMRVSGDKATGRLLIGGLVNGSYWAWLHFDRKQGPAIAAAILEASGGQPPRGERWPDPEVLTGTEYSPATPDYCESAALWHLRRSAAVLEYLAQPSDEDEDALREMFSQSPELRRQVRRFKDKKNGSSPF